MACGRLCLVANEGFKQTLGEYADRFVFSYGNPQHLAERLMWILSLSRDDRSSIGGYFRRQVMSMHGLDRLARRLVDLFESKKVPANAETIVPVRLKDTLAFVFA